MWTMEELIERVRSALAEHTYPGAPNGRVRDLPDRRAIRWYATIGLVDRPLGTRDRVALYGPRHLLQLVAIKRRQAAGRTLAEIQAELAGASDEELTAAARVPAGLLATDPPPPAAAPRHGFWRHTPTLPAPTPPAHSQPAPTLPAPAGQPAPAAPEPATPVSAAIGTTTQELLAEVVRRERKARGDRPSPADTGFVLNGVPLGMGVILLVPQPIDDLDQGELAAAARPLLDLLASRGLTDGRNE